MPASLIGARIRITYDHDQSVAIGKVVLYKHPALVVQIESGVARNIGSARVEAFTSCERKKLTVSISGEMTSRMVLLPTSPLLSVPSALPLKILREETFATINTGVEEFPVTIVGGGATAIYFEATAAVPVVDGVTFQMIAGSANLTVVANVMTQTISDNRYAGVAEIKSIDRIGHARWQKLIA